MRKYRNIPTVVDNIRFASKKEAARYGELKMLEENDDITHLCWQTPFVLEVNGQKICTYVADFQYRENGKIVVEDVKGRKTPVYRLKAKLMKACWGIEIRET